MYSTIPSYSSMLVWLLLITSPVKGQSPLPSPAIWAVTLQLGAPISSPNSAIRKFMENNALGGSSSYSGTTYPNTKAVPSLALTVEFFRSHSSLGIQFSIAEGSVNGNQNALMRWQALSLAPLYSYYSRQRTSRISLGPSVQWLQTEAGTDRFPGLFGTTAQLIKKTGVVPGLVIEGAVRFPARSTVYMELGARYDGVFGQLTNELHLPFAGMGRVIPYSLRFNRVTLSAGFGLRLGGRKRSNG